MEVLGSVTTMVSRIDFVRHLPELLLDTFRKRIVLARVKTLYIWTTSYNESVLIGTLRASS